MWKNVENGWEWVGMVRIESKMGGIAWKQVVCVLKGVESGWTWVRMGWRLVGNGFSFIFLLAGTACLGTVGGLGYMGLAKSTLITKWGAAREETAVGALTLLLLVLWQDTENKDVLGKLSTSVLHSPKVASTATPWIQIFLKMASLH